MTKREKVVKALECGIGIRGSCDDCPYNNDFNHADCEIVMRDALELLKEQEARELTIDEWREWKHGIITQEQMKSTYQVMLELSKTWQNLDDALKNIITNLLAETSNNKALRTVDEAIEQIRLMEEILSKAKLDKTN